MSPLKYPGVNDAVVCVDQKATGTVRIRVNSPRVINRTLSTNTPRRSPGTVCSISVNATPSARLTVRRWWRCGGSTC